jgi:hypothetical protein
MLRLSIDQLACHHSDTERGQQPEEMGHKTPPPTETELSTLRRCCRPLRSAHLAARLCAQCSAPGRITRERRPAARRGAGR